MKPGGAVLAALILLSGGAAAQQLDFKRVSRSGDELLSYRWKDSERHEHAVAFTLTRQAIKQAETSFVEFSMDAMWRYLELDLRDEVETFGNGARINLSRSVEGLRWSLEARDQKSVDLLSRKVTERLDKSQQAYLAQHLRRMVGQHRVMVDFAAATTATQGPLQAVARSLGELPDVANNDRAKIALALGFFQEIPYALLRTLDAAAATLLPALAPAGAESRRLRQQGRGAGCRAEDLTRRGANSRW